MPPLSLRRLKELSGQPKPQKSPKLKPLRPRPVSSLSSKKKSSSSSFASRGTPRGIVYLSHLPHGFYEQELRRFLGQFGCITNLRVGRSVKTGNSKGYAFVEFAHPEVASIVADTMNNYLMFDRIVKSRVLEESEVRVGRKAIFAQKIVQNRPEQDKQRVISTSKSERRRRHRLRSKLREVKKDMADVVTLDISAFDTKENQVKVGKAKVNTEVNDKKAKSQVVDKEKNKKVQMGNHMDSDKENKVGNERKKKINDIKKEVKSNNLESKKKKKGNKVNRVDMVVDTEEEEVTLKTPPNVRKVSKTKQKKGSKK